MKIINTVNNYIIGKKYVIEKEKTEKTLFLSSTDTDCLIEVISVCEDSKYKQGDILWYDTEYRDYYRIDNDEYIIIDESGVIAKIEV